MNPLQLYLIQHYEAKPGGRVPLKDFVANYIFSLDGSEDAQWRTSAHIVAALAAGGFTIVRGNGNVRQLLGLIRKPESSPCITRAEEVKHSV